MSKLEIKKTIKDIFTSKVFKVTIYFLGIIIIASFIFQAGVFVGFHKASFGRDWGENYSKNFGPKHRNPIGGALAPDVFPNAHGAIGKIIRIELPTITVSDKDGLEKSILITDDTDIHLMRGDVSPDKLALDNYIVVIGSPNSQGQIEAKLIRILPAPPEKINNQATTATTKE